MSFLSLSLLGGFEAKLDGVLLTAFSTDKVRALLAFLAVESNYPRRRSELAVMLWPNSTEKRASHNLSQTLLRLRRALQVDDSAEQPFLLISRQDIQFNPHCNHQIDINRFHELFQAYRQHQHPNAENCHTCMQWLEQAVKLYRGEFLSGFYVRDSVDFEEWRTVKQQKLHREAIEALTLLTTYYEKNEKYERMLEYAQRHVNLEPWDGLAVLKLIQAQAFCGHTAMALKQYEAYRLDLAQKLNAAPAKEVTAVYEKIKLGKVWRPKASKSFVSTPAIPSEQEAYRPMTILVCNRRRESQQHDVDVFFEHYLVCEGACESIIRRFGGHRLPRLGDSCLICFGYPKSQEDMANRAICAGLALTGHEMKCAKEIRVGIDAGMMLVRGKRRSIDQTNDLIGRVPDLARRCQDLAKPGETLITQRVLQLVRGIFDHESLGAHILVNHTQPVEIYRVLGKYNRGSQLKKLALTPNLSPFVGREDEFAILWNGWKQLLQGKGQVIGISGEAGIGKSRLLAEFKRQVVRQDENWNPIKSVDDNLAIEASLQSVLWLESYCLPFMQGSSFYPLVMLLEQMLGFAEQDSSEMKVNKLAGLLTDLGEMTPISEWLMALLLHLPGERPFPPIITSKQREHMGETIVKLLRKLAARQPVYIVIEDIHWADPSTIEWLGRSLASLIDVQCHVLLTYRPSFSPPWLPQDSLLNINLAPLNIEQREKMIGHLITDGLLSKKDHLHIVTQSNGLPLFIEELTRTLIETGPGQDNSPTNKPNSSNGVTTFSSVTLNNVLIGRIDHLDQAKETLQWAAALGQEFSYPILQKVTRFEEQRLKDDLQELYEENLILPPQKRTFSHLHFRHALLRETVYVAIPKRIRQIYHQRIAETIENSFPSISQQQPEILAKHYALAKLPSKAVDKWLLAGKRAVSLNSIQEARIFYDNAIELIAPDDFEQRWQAISKREDVLSLLGEKEAREADIATMLEIAEALNDDAKRAQAFLQEEILAATILQEDKRALKAADLAIAAANRANVPSLEVRALIGKMQVLTTSGKRVDAKKIIEEIIEKKNRMSHGDVHPDVFGHIAYYYAESGDLTLAIEHWIQSVEAARREENHLLAGKLAVNLGFTYAQLGLYKDANKILESGLAQAENLCDLRLQAMFSINLGFVHWQCGNIDQATQMLKQALEQFKKSGDIYGQFSSQAYLGFVHTEMKEWDSASHYLQKALSGFLQLDMMPPMLEVKAVKAYCLLAQGNRDDAWRLAEEGWYELQEHGSEGMDLPALMYLHLAKVFNGFETEDAAFFEYEVIEKGYNELMQNANKLSNLEWQKSFIENVPDNQKLIKRWLQIKDGTPSLH